MISCARNELVVVFTAVAIAFGCGGREASKPAPPERPGRPDENGNAGKTAAQPEPDGEGRRRRPAELTVEARKRFRDALRRGRRLAKKGDHQAAARAFEEALEAAPGDARAASELGWEAFRAGDMPRARKATLESIAGTAEPETRAASLYNLGRIEEAEGRKERAAQVYRDSLALRPNPTVRARLLAVAPNTPPDESLVATTLDGPHSSLADWCAAYVAANPEEPCSPYQVMFEQQAGQLRAKGAWKEVQVLRVGPFEICALAVRTRAGWFVEPWIAECRELGGRWDRVVTADEIAFRDVLPGGDPELVLRLSSEMVSNITDPGAQPDAQVLQESTERLYLLCGIGASGHPSCLPPLTVAYDVSFSAEPEGTPTPEPEHWSVALSSNSDGIELRAEKGAGSMSAEAAKLLGRHRLDFP
jgi:tetratricopeptide (TPR) repeat protein